jgi:hypothetical protein
MLYVDIANDRAFNKVIASELLAPGTTTFTDTVPPAGRKILLSNKSGERQRYF